MTEQTDPDPYSIALRRLENFSRAKHARATLFLSDGTGWVARLSIGDKHTQACHDTLTDAINAACDAVEGV